MKMNRDKKKKIRSVGLMIAAQIELRSRIKTKQ